MHKQLAALAAVVAAATIGAAPGGAFIFPVHPPPGATQAQVNRILANLFGAGLFTPDTCPWADTPCWGYNDDDGRNEPGIGGSDGSPDPDAPPNGPPAHAGEENEIWVGADGIVWVCKVLPRELCMPVSGSGSPHVDPGDEGVVGPYLPRVPTWVARPIGEYVADQLAALPPYNPDDEAIAEWVAAGLDAGAFDPCAYAAWKAEQG